MSRCSGFSVLITIISLSFCLFVQDVHAADKNVNKANKCGATLINVPSVLKPVGASNSTEIIETSAIDIPGVKKGIFSFSIDDERKGQIEIEYKYGEIDDMYFLSGIDFEFLKKVFDAIPAVLLSRLDKVTILFKKTVLQPPFVMEEVVDISHREKEMPLEGAQDRSLTSRMSLIVPYFPQDQYKNTNFNVFYDLLVHQMRHTIIGYVMIYHRYRDRVPGRQWRVATIRDIERLSIDDDISEDKEKVFSDSGINMAEDFANTMELYLRTHGGLGYIHITKGFHNRFEILDEIVGLDLSQRERITKRNRLLEEQADEVNYLLKQLGIIDNEGVVYEGIGEDVPQQITAFLPRHPNRMRVLKKLGDKALVLHKNGQLDFTSVKSSSARENLIRLLIWPGLFFVPQNEAGTPQFITDTINLLDTLSDSEIERRFYIFNEAIEFIERINDQSLLDQEPYMVFEKALREVQNRSD